MSFDQAVAVAKSAMCKRVAVMIYPHKWLDDGYGVQLLQDGLTRTFDGFTAALDGIDEMVAVR